MIKDFINLIYPQLCLSCGDVLLKNEKICCTKCKIELPITNFHLSPHENEVKQKFAGKVIIQQAFSFLHFVKHGKVQNLLHQLKYRGKEQVGEMLGTWYGNILSTTTNIEKFDLIVPVPMHKIKLKKRGYNQVDSFAKGLSKSINTSWRTDVLLKVNHTSSQTKKSRLNRWRNVKEVFLFNTKYTIEGKHILLVDDVITTGSTLESCAEILISQGAKVSIATIAHAN